MTYIIVDFEATCCDQNSFPVEEMEIIEFGAVALRGNGPEVESEFCGIVKPVRHPVLTEFCTDLTSITQDMVDDAEGFPGVLAAFSEWISTFDSPVFCSWGKYDKNQLTRDCAFHGAPYPFSDDHINIKKVFAANRGGMKQVGLKRALSIMGLEMKGTHHRGIDDARNMARLASAIFM